jgi:hypothetical protein
VTVYNPHRCYTLDTGEGQIREEAYDCDGDEIADITCRSPASGDRPAQAAVLFSEAGSACITDKVDHFQNKTLEEMCIGRSGGSSQLAPVLQPVALDPRVAARLKDNPPIRRLQRATECEGALPSTACRARNVSKHHKWDCDGDGIADVTCEFEVNVARGVAGNNPACTFANLGSCGTAGTAEVI